MNNDPTNNERMNQEHARRVTVPTKGLIWSIIVFSAVALWAVDSITPLNVKEGLWEMTVTHSMTGMPAAPNLPPDALAKQYRRPQGMRN